MSTLKNTQQALYQRIAGDLRSEINEGVITEKLPTEHELMKTYATARPTVKNALNVLINEGLIYADRPRGYFVRTIDRVDYQPQKEFLPRPQNVAKDLFLTAHETRAASQEIKVEIIKPPTRVAEQLNLDETQLVVVRRRVRFLDGERWNTSDSYFPLDLVKGTAILDPNAIPKGSNAVLADLGAEQVRAIDEIITRMPTPEERERLQIPLGTPVAIHYCTGYTESGKPVRFVVNCLPGDRHSIIYEHHRIPENEK